jgi:hypothetical protein
MLSEKDKNKPNNPVCAVWWYDAAYSFEKELPEEMPKLQLTVGFVIETNNEFLNIATDVRYKEETSEIIPERGQLIPEKAIVEFKKIGFLHE